MPRRLFSLALVLVFVLSATGRAQANGAFDHWAAIDRVLKDLGGISNISKARPDQRGLLAFHYSERGQFLLDLYEYERIIVRDHALHRDSIGKNGGPPVPAAQYFLGRAFQELGQEREAATAYGAVSASSPERIRTLAAEWSATLSGSGGKGWKRDVINWRDGKAVSATDCPPATSVCDLFEAVVESNVTSIARIQREIMLSQLPDHREIIRTATEPYPVDFFDPLTLYVLATADFTLAAHVLQGVAASPDVEAINGIALFRSGRTKDAEAVLRRAASTARGAAALGELLFVTGNQAEAERVWRTVSGTAPNLVLDARGRVGAESPTTLRQNAIRQYESEKGKRWAGMKEGSAGGDYLARALLRLDRPREALDVLDAVRPPSFGSDLNKVRPDILVLSSRARYMLGRREPEHFPFARGDLADLAENFAVVTPALKLLQVITAPPNFGIVR